MLLKDFLSTLMTQFGLVLVNNEEFDCDCNGTELINTYGNHKITAWQIIQPRVFVDYHIKVVLDNNVEIRLKNFNIY